MKLILATIFTALLFATSAHAATLPTLDDCDLIAGPPWSQQELQSLQAGTGLSEKQIQTIITAVEERLTVYCRKNAAEAYAAKHATRKKPATGPE